MGFYLKGVSIKYPREGNHPIRHGYEFHLHICIYAHSHIKKCPSVPKPKAPVTDGHFKNYIINSSGLLPKHNLVGGGPNGLLSIGHAGVVQVPNSRGVPHKYGLLGSIRFQSKHDLLMAGPGA